MWAFKRAPTINMTRERPYSKGEGKAFSGPVEVRMAYESGVVGIQAKIRCRIKGKTYDTTVGRPIDHKAR